MVVMTMDMVAVIHLRKCRDFSGKCKIPARKIVSGCLFSGFPARIPEGIVRLSAAARPFPGPAAACGLFRPVRPPFSFLRRSDRDVPGDFPCRALVIRKRFPIFVCGKFQYLFLYGKFTLPEEEIDYRLEEVVFDCDMAICFQPSKEKEIFEVMQEAVALRNDLFSKAMNPAEPHNRSLVRKHYAALRAEMADAFGKLFEKLSAINEQKK